MDKSPRNAYTIYGIMPNTPIDAAKGDEDDVWFKKPLPPRLRHLMRALLCTNARLVKNLADMIAFLNVIGEARARRKIQ